MDKNYVKRINDSQNSAIYCTFSHLAAFVKVAVTKRFNVNRFNLYACFYIYMSIDKHENTNIDLSIIRSYNKLLVAHKKNSCASYR